VVHEIAHTIDNFHFWNGTDDLYFFYKYHKISNDEEIKKIIGRRQAGAVAIEVVRGFEYLGEVNEGRYTAIPRNKLAELLAQYILNP